VGRRDCVCVCVCVLGGEGGQRGREGTGEELWTNTCRGGPGNPMCSYGLLPMVCHLCPCHAHKSPCTAFQQDVSYLPAHSTSAHQLLTSTYSPVHTDALQTQRRMRCWLLSSGQQGGLHGSASSSHGLPAAVQSGLEPLSPSLPPCHPAWQHGGLGPPARLPMPAWPHQPSQQARRQQQSVSACHHAQGRLLSTYSACVCMTMTSGMMLGCRPMQTSLMTTSQPALATSRRTQLQPGSTKTQWRRESNRCVQQSPATSTLPWALPARRHMSAPSGQSGVLLECSSALFGGQSSRSTTAPPLHQPVPPISLGAPSTSSTGHGRHLACSRCVGLCEELCDKESAMVVLAFK
jgi:hypothetical protein